MDKRFHISPDGEARACSAKTACRYGENVPHFSTKDDARTAYEAAQAGSFHKATLTKQAADANEDFIYEGVTFDANLWEFEDSGRGPNGTVALSQDGFSYTLNRDYDGWGASVYKADKKYGGWEGVKGPKHSRDLSEVVAAIEVKVRNRANVTEGRVLSDEEFQVHVKAQRDYYDVLDELYKKRQEQTPEKAIIEDLAEENSLPFKKEERLKDLDESSRIAYEELRSQGVSQAKALKAASELPTRQSKKI